MNNYFAEENYINFLLETKELLNEVWDKSKILKTCNKLNLRSFQVCQKLYERGYWN